MSHSKSKAFFLIFLFVTLMVAGVFDLLNGQAATAVAAPTADSCFISINNSNTTDYTSADASVLQTAVDAANPGDLLKIAGTCAGVQETAGISQTVYISQNLTLQGGYTTTNWLAAPDPDTYPTVLDADNSGRVVYIASGAEVTLAGLTMQNGTSTADGGGIYNSSVLTLSHSLVAHNSVGVGNDGGGLYTPSGTGSTFISHSDFISNTTGRHGGGLYGSHPITITHSRFEQNVSNTGYGGGIYVGYTTLNVNNSVISGNVNQSGGGGIYIDFNTTTISNSLISGNTARQGGGIDFYGGTLTVVSSTLQYNQAITTTGGAINNQTGSVNLVDSLVQHNQAETNGGGLYVANGGVLTATLSTLGGNISANGGGLYITGGNAQVLLDETTVYSNSANSGGGGLYLNHANITILGGQIISNTASGGGGIFHNNSGTSVFSGTQISHNRANNGGGLQNNWGTRHIFTNTVLSHNQATNGDGGGFFLINGGWVSMVDSTVYSNTASSDGGGLFNDLLSTMHLTDTIVSHNQAGATGGGIRTDKLLTLHGGQIISNSITSFGSDGGGLHLGHANAIVTQTGVLTIAYNYADRYGGGIHVANGYLTMDGARIADNYADDDGGGLYVNAGQVQIDSARILDNRSDNSGSGIYQASSTTGITVTNSCLVFNDYSSVYHTGGPTISATGNWWGAGDGPGGDAPGHGNRIVGDVDYSGFLTTAPSDCPSYSPILTITNGNNQATEIGQDFTESLTVRLAMDNNGVPFAGEVITLTGPSSGAGIIPSIITATTNAGGFVYNIIPTANDIWGEYEVIATASIATDPVTFTLQNYTFFTLTTAYIGTGSGSVTPSGVYTNGESVVITATENLGSYFLGWAGDATGTTNPLTVTMDSDKAITATFDLLTYTLSTATVGNGSIILDPAGGVYDYGTVVTLTAVADTGSTFIGWSGACTNTVGDCVVTIDQALNVTATFVEEYRIYLPMIIKP